MSFCNNDCVLQSNIEYFQTSFFVLEGNNECLLDLITNPMRDDGAVCEVVCVDCSMMNFFSFVRNDEKT